MNLLKLLIILIIIAIIVYFIIINYNKSYKENYDSCNLDNLDIDNIDIIQRTPEYSKLIDKIIDTKSFIFNDEQLKILKNSQQIFKVTNNQSNIENISDLIYTNCKGKLDNQLSTNSIGSTGSTNSTDSFDSTGSTNSNDLLIESDKNYENIINKMEYDINNIIEPNCYNTAVLQNNKYLKNYYRDFYGNKVQADLSDYFVDYYTQINNNSNDGVPVKTLLGKSNFIIPDQYNTEKYFTNAYNIDWSRIIEPLGYI